MDKMQVGLWLAVVAIVGVVAFGLGRLSVHAPDLPDGVFCRPPWQDFRDCSATDDLQATAWTAQIIKRGGNFSCLFRMEDNTSDLNRSLMGGSSAALPPGEPMWAGEQQEPKKNISSWEITPDPGKRRR